MSKDLLELTEDEFEREVLLSTDYAERDPDDPMFHELANLATHIQNLTNTVPYGQRKLIPFLRQDGTNVSKAEKANVSTATVAAAMNNPTVKRIMNLLNRIHHMRMGPTEEQRLYMLWTIAKREQIKKPNVTLKAIDIINRQRGVYADPTGKNGAGGFVVNIQNFSVTANNPTTHEKIRDITPPPSHSKFVPVTIEIDDPHA